MVQLSNGDVIIGGNFTAINGVPKRCLAKLFLSEQTPEPVLLGPFYSDKEFHLYFPTIRARTYVLESNNDVGSTAWAAVGSLRGDGNWKTIKDAVTSAGN